jgi:arginine decarboxylase
LPRYILPKYDEQAGQCLCITPEDVAEALEKEPDIEAVYVTYPTYDGLCCDLKAIADIAHAKGVKVLVDGAHSAHFNFSELMPPHPGACGADVWVQSAHKTLPALTQSAFLHVGKAEYVEQVGKVLDILQTTSPSYLLMASLDRAKTLMAEQGRQKMNHMVTLVTNSSKRFLKSREFGFTTKR